MDEPHHLPLVSVILPIRNEAAFIDATIASVFAQDYPPERLEIVVADGCSDDGTREIVSRFVAGEATQAADPAGAGARVRVVMVENAERTMPNGANAAIRAAHGDVHLILGGHARLPRDYVRRCVEGLRTTGADCVGGAMESTGAGYVGGAIAAAMSSPFGVGGSGFRVAALDGAPVPTDTVPFGLYRREVWERIGLYRPEMVRHQDYELNYRLRRAGGRIVLLPAARVSYQVRSSLTRLWMQYWEYGIWKGRFARAHPASLRPRHLAPPLLVLALAGAALLAFTPLGLVLPLTLVLASYVAFMLVALVAMSARGAGRYAPLLPLILACLHLSYGLGVWVGLLTPSAALARPAPAVR